MMFCGIECLCTVYPLESGEVKRLKFYISGWNRMLQLYIESATAPFSAFSDYEESKEFLFFVGLQKWTSTA